MNDALNSVTRPPALVRGRGDSMTRRLVLNRLAELREGELTLIDGAEQWLFGRATAAFPLRAAVTVHDRSFWADIAYGGSVGAGEAYTQGHWDADDLTTAIRILLRNREVVDGMETGLARLREPLLKGLHWLRRNTVSGARRNIAAHYDLGNEFFASFLDESMMYSSAIFEHSAMTLHEASIAKLDRVCRKLDLAPEDHVLEIGAGWGGFAVHAASRYGCRVTTTTISGAQYDYARARVTAAGLNDRVTVLLSDYRDLTGSYDKLVSIEMIEAVGHDHFDTFFRCCGERLKPEGMMLLQAITIADHRYEAARRSVDFIKRYIFPGCCIPSVAAMSASIARASDLRLFHLEDIGPHYALTLRAWRERLVDNIERVRALGYSEAFLRMWMFYLCYCEGGFAERALGNAQMLLIKPQCRRNPIL